MQLGDRSVGRSARIHLSFFDHMRHVWLSQVELLSQVAFRFNLTHVPPCSRHAWWKAATRHGQPRAEPLMASRASHLHVTGRKISSSVPPHEARARVSAGSSTQSRGSRAAERSAHSR